MANCQTQGIRSTPNERINGLETVNCPRLHYSRRLSVVIAIEVS